MFARSLWRDAPRKFGGLLTAARAAHTTVSEPLPSDFTLFPDFLTAAEQCTLLQACLDKLDAAESREARKRRRIYLQSLDAAAHPRQTDSTEDLFLPDKLYEFQEVRSSSIAAHATQLGVFA